MKNSGRGTDLRNVLISSIQGKILLAFSSRRAGFVISYQYLLLNKSSDVRKFLW